MKVKKMEYDAATGEYKEIYEEDLPSPEEPEIIQEQTLEEKVQELQDNILNLQSVLISQKISGGGITITDSSALSVKNFGMRGKTEQESTTGVQLFDIDSFLKQEIEDVMTFGKGRQLIMTLKPNTQYTMSTDNVGDINSGTPEKDRSLYFTTVDDITLNGRDTAVVKGTPRTVTSDESGQIKIILLDSENATPITKKEKYVMLNEGSATLIHEEYTGGKPSPSVEYPQEIVSAGKYDETSGKYLLDVSVTGKNLINEEHFFDLRNWTKNLYPVQLVPNTKYTFSRRDNSGYKSGMFLQIKRTVEGAFSQVINTNSELYCKQKVTFTTNETGLIEFQIQNANNINFKDMLGYAQLEKGSSFTAHEPFKLQTLAIPLDRPLTKWDRIEKRDGVWGVAYKHSVVDDLATLVKDNTIIYGSSEKRYFSINFKDVNFNYDYSKAYSEVGLYKKDINVLYVPQLQTVSAVIGVSDIDTIETAKEHLHYKVIYETDSEEFVPLPEETQIALNSLHTNYPTTVVTNSEDCEMEVEYIADTKNYIDKQMQAIVTKQIETDRLILERTM